MKNKLSVFLILIASAFLLAISSFWPVLALTKQSAINNRIEQLGLRNEQNSPNSQSSVLNPSLDGSSFTNSINYKFDNSDITLIQDTATQDGFTITTTTEGNRTTTTTVTAPHVVDTPPTNNVIQTPQPNPQFQSPTPQPLPQCGNNSTPGTKCILIVPLPSPSSTPPQNPTSTGSGVPAPYGDGLPASPSTYYCGNKIVPEPPECEPPGIKCPNGQICTQDCKCPKEKPPCLEACFSACEKSGATFNAEAFKDMPGPIVGNGVDFAILINKFLAKLNNQNLTEDQFKLLCKNSCPLYCFGPPGQNGLPGCDNFGTFRPPGRFAKNSLGQELAFKGACETVSNYGSEGNVSELIETNIFGPNAVLPGDPLSPIEVIKDLRPLNGHTPLPVTLYNTPDGKFTYDPLPPPPLNPPPLPGQNGALFSTAWLQENELTEFNRPRGRNGSKDPLGCYQCNVKFVFIPVKIGDSIRCESYGLLPTFLGLSAATHTFDIDDKAVKNISSDTTPAVKDLKKNDKHNHILAFHRRINCDNYLKDHKARFNCSLQNGTWQEDNQDTPPPQGSSNTGSSNPPNPLGTCIFPNNGTGP